MKGFPEQLRRPQQVIRKLLENGSRITVVQGNRIAETTETRRIISRLRADGLLVKDYWEVKNGRRFKHYYLERPLPTKGSTHDVLQGKLEIN